MATLSTNIQYLKGVGENVRGFMRGLALLQSGICWSITRGIILTFPTPVPSSALLMMNLAPFGPGSQPSQQSSAFGKGFPCSRYWLPMGETI